MKCTADQSHPSETVEHEIAGTAAKLRNKIETLIGNSAQNFIFKEGPLLKMMRVGGWILLDGVDSAPHEVERLMLFLEEEPTLSFYEGVRPLLSFRKDSSPPVIEGGDGVQEELIEISESFQVFITCRDSRKLSPVLRSRCFCVHVEAAGNENSLQELGNCILSRSGNTSSHGLPLSLALAQVHNSMKPDSRLGTSDKALHFSQDTFSPHRIGNCARGFGNDSLTATSISYGFRMSFASCFREDQDRSSSVTKGRDRRRMSRAKQFKQCRVAWRVSSRWSSPATV
jgi:hypothetical protein